MQTKKIILKIIIFSILNLIIAADLLTFFSGRNREIRLKNWETESNLLVTGENGHYDLAILGTSRGRVFSRDSNHLTIERILGKKVINLSKGGGGGLMPAKIHLAHFYRRGNSASQIIYFIDPWIFFCLINNEDNTFFLRDEPFEASVMFDLIFSGFPSQRIISYIQMIAVNDWKNIGRYAAPGLDRVTLKAIDPLKLEEARNHYLGLYDYDRFEHYSSFVSEINSMAKEQGSRITYIVLPILMKDFPGAAEVDKKLREISSSDKVGYCNLIDKMHDREFFYDHMHFNNRGVSYFTKNYLAPLIK